MKLQFRHFIIRFSVFPVLVFLCLLPLLVSLGIWQLGRAEEKKIVLKMLAQRQKHTVSKLTADEQASTSDLKYRRVHVVGAYDPQHQFLIDNQIVSGKPGYFVLTPFILANSDKAILVNRGWVQLNKDRKQLPEINFTSDELSVSGRINSFPSVGLKLAGAEIPSKGWPSVVQVIDSAVLEKTLGFRLFGFQLQLDSNQNHGYWREWKTHVPMPPEKHFAYAMQWFGLALTLIILFFVYGFKYEHSR